MCSNIARGEGDAGATEDVEEHENSVRGLARLDRFLESIIGDLSRF